MLFWPRAANFIYAISYLTFLFRQTASSKKLPPMHSLVDEIVTTEEEYVVKLHMLDKVSYGISIPSVLPLSIPAFF